ncbi:MAG: hypothetical protein QW056_06480, partial [Candidatus Bathyarchaeia archaeon]
DKALKRRSVAERVIEKIAKSSLDRLLKSVATKIEERLNNRNKNDATSMPPESNLNAKMPLSVLDS